MRIGKFIFSGFLLALALLILAKLVFIATIGAIAAGMVFMVAHAIKRWKYEQYVRYNGNNYHKANRENMSFAYDRARIMAQPLDGMLGNRYKYYAAQPDAYRNIEVL